MTSGEGGAVIKWFTILVQVNAKMINQATKELKIF